VFAKQLLWIVAVLQLARSTKERAVFESVWRWTG